MEEWKASEEVINERREICNSCDKRIVLGNICSECMCIISFKTTVKIFECPLLKWTKVE